MLVAGVRERPKQTQFRPDGSSKPPWKTSEGTGRRRSPGDMDSGIGGKVNNIGFDEEPLDFHEGPLGDSMNTHRNRLAGGPSILDRLLVDAEDDAEVVGVGPEQDFTAMIGPATALIQDMTSANVANVTSMPTELTLRAEPAADIGGGMLEQAYSQVMEGSPLWFHGYKGTIRFAQESICESCITKIESGPPGTFMVWVQSWGKDGRCSHSLGICCALGVHTDTIAATVKLYDDVRDTKVKTFLIDRDDKGFLVFSPQPPKKAPSLTIPSKADHTTGKFKDEDTQNKTKESIESTIQVALKDLQVKDVKVDLQKVGKVFHFLVTIINPDYLSGDDFFKNLALKLLWKDDFKWDGKFDDPTKIDSAKAAKLKKSIDEAVKAATGQSPKVIIDNKRRSNERQTKFGYGDPPRYFMMFGARVFPNSQAYDIPEEHRTNLVNLIEFVQQGTSDFPHKLKHPVIRIGPSPE
eukprot:gnl/MRDRNA2_/MRDRNA2_145951_c0_seq1.p1 gnl/MRDRNA2_/MRDRNA2_145951_c0~~gnl/MRDRNA2_/MRDRNA2_145951_c0_seq1.p1  ORF type:complete len:474 (-),score=82.33 gnl/MRDRNA2_/MRDRNA2_145951_c0_seq1:239-1636(-)